LTLLIGVSRIDNLVCGLLSLGELFPTRVRWLLHGARLHQSAVLFNSCRTTDSIRRLACDVTWSLEAHLFGLHSAVVSDGRLDSIVLHGLYLAEVYLGMFYGGIILRYLQFPFRRPASRVLNLPAGKVRCASVRSVGSIISLVIPPHRHVKVFSDRL